MNSNRAKMSNLLPLEDLQLFKSTRMKDAFLLIILSHVIYDRFLELPKQLYRKNRNCISNLPSINIICPLGRMKFMIKSIWKKRSGNTMSLDKCHMANQTSIKFNSHWGWKSKSDINYTYIYFTQVGLAKKDNYYIVIWFWQFQFWSTQHTMIQIEWKLVT